MEETNSENKARNEPEKPKKELTPEQRQRQKKMLIYPLMGLLFIGCMWLIFAPSESDKEKEQQEQGFNTNVPLPNDATLIGDKQVAYEKAQMETKQNERRTQMQDLASLFGGTEEDTQADYDLMNPEPKPKTSSRGYGGGGGSTRPRETIQSSASAYNDINRTLGNFYETPKEDPEKEEMKKELEELREMAYNKQTEQDVAADQLALLEKSYELAAKYMPSGQGSSPTTTPSATTDGEKAPATVKNGKALINPVGQVTTSVVTTLSQPMSDSVFVAEYSKERNMGFNTAVGTEGKADKNTIRACVHDNQTITDGQSVRLRLLEPMKAGTTVIPRNALVTGMAKIQGDRLGIDISSLEYAGTIIPIELAVYDTDGQQGIFIPGSMELNAVKEVAANMGSSLGTSVSITNQGAGDQLLTELGKGAIQGASQYISKKMKVVKVHLKAGYKLMLYQDKNN